MKPNLKLNIMYKVQSKQHYVIDWNKVESIEDLKKIIKTLNISFDPTSKLEEIKHLIKLEDITVESTQLFPNSIHC